MLLMTGKFTFTQHVIAEKNLLEKEQNEGI